MGLGEIEFSYRVFAYILICVNVYQAFIMMEDKLSKDDIPETSKRSQC